jgi:hypothetical protein
MGKVIELHPSQVKPLYKNQIATVGDLENLKSDLLFSFRQILADLKGQFSKKWLKSYEVKRMLGISTGTLQNMRNNKTLPFTKMGGTIYYDNADIERILLEKKKNNPVVTTFPDLTPNSKTYA